MIMLNGLQGGPPRMVFLGGGGYTLHPLVHAPAAVQPPVVSLVTTSLESPSPIYSPSGLRGATIQSSALSHRERTVLMPPSERSPSGPSPPCPVALLSALTFLSFSCRSS